MKISCMQRICTPSRPARSISFMCLAMFASRMVSSFSAVEQAWDAWISPHFTIRGMSIPLALSASRTLRRLALRRASRMSTR